MVKSICRVNAAVDDQLVSIVEHTSVTKVEKKIHVFS